MDLRQRFREVFGPVKDKVMDLKTIGEMVVATSDVERGQGISETNRTNALTLLKQ